MSSLIHSGLWNLPVIPSYLCNEIITDWLSNFHFPEFDLGKDDLICWEDIKASKVNTRVIWESVRTHREELQWHESVWFKNGITIYIFHSWLLCHGKLNTLDRLHKWGVTPDIHCYLCAGGLESHNHLFLSCYYSDYILQNIFSGNLGINVGLRRGWSDFLILLQNVTDKHKKKISYIAAQVYVYHIWKERNRRMHNGKVSNPHKVLKEIMSDLRSRLNSSKWFIKLIVFRPDIQLWIV